MSRRGCGVRTLAAVTPLGLIAGQGTFPLLVAEGARAAGRPVRCVGIGDLPDPRLPGLCDDYRRLGLLQVGRWARHLGTPEAIMVGRVDHKLLHGRLRYLQFLPDPATVGILWRIRRDKRPAAVLNGVADALRERGVTLIDSTAYSREHLATAGTMTRRAPTPAEAEDVAHGWEVARQLSRLDVGQCLAIREKNVLAVEAVEGTAAMITRAGALSRGSPWTLVKVGNTHHDMRFDVPCVGTDTIQQLADAGCRCLAVAAGRTMLLDRPKVLAAADAAGIAVVGRDDE